MVVRDCWNKCGESSASLAVGPGRVCEWVELAGKCGEWRSRLLRYWPPWASHPGRSRRVSGVNELVVQGLGTEVGISFALETADEIATYLGHVRRNTSMAWLMPIDVESE
jgi:hypothetical protein